jgi:hypothetical protein
VRGSTPPLRGKADGPRASGWICEICRKKITEHDEAEGLGESESFSLNASRRSHARLPRSMFAVSLQCEFW